MAMMVSSVPLQWLLRMQLRCCAAYSPIAAGCIRCRHEDKGVGVKNTSRYSVDGRLCPQSTLSALYSQTYVNQRGSRWEERLRPLELWKCPQKSRKQRRRGGLGTTLAANHSSKQLQKAGPDEPFTTSNGNQDTLPWRQFMCDDDIGLLASPHELDGPRGGDGCFFLLVKPSIAVRGLWPIRH